MAVGRYGGMVVWWYSAHPSTTLLIQSEARIHSKGTTTYTAPTALPPYRLTTCVLHHCGWPLKQAYRRAPRATETI
jgi:hypothetical protein